MNFSEKWGKDIDEAVELALKDLKLTRDEVTVQVLEEPSKGFLGIGSKLAKVRVEPKTESGSADGYKEEIKEEAAPEKEVEAPKAPEQKERADLSENKTYEKKERAPKKKSAPKKHRTESINKRPDDLEPVEDHEALDFLKKVTKEMGLDLAFKAAMNAESIYIDIEGEEVGSIIGKRGQTLDSIQYLTSLVVNKKKDKYLRVVLDAENYRDKREQTLEQLADRLADKVVKTRRTVRLEPMNPYERMIIHATLQDDDRVKTRSEGNEPYRRVIIELK